MLESYREIKMDALLVVLSNSTISHLQYLGKKGKDRRGNRTVMAFMEIQRE